MTTFLNTAHPRSSETRSLASRRGRLLLPRLGDDLDWITTRLRS